MRKYSSDVHNSHNKERNVPTHCEYDMPPFYLELKFLPKSDPSKKERVCNNKPYNEPSKVSLSIVLCKLERLVSSSCHLNKVHTEAIGKESKKENQSWKCFNDFPIPFKSNALWNF